MCFFSKLLLTIVMDIARVFCGRGESTYISKARHCFEQESDCLMLHLPSILSQDSIEVLHQVALILVLITKFQAINHRSIFFILP